MVKYSVIIPVFNCARYLSDCVNSVLSQTTPDWELLLIDDGSTDGGAVLCDQFARDDPRVRVFHKPNGGAASARNVGLDNIKGEYVLFIDGDDTVEPDLLEQHARSLDKSDAQMTIFGMAFDYYDAVGDLEKTEHLSVGHRGNVTTKDLLADYASYFSDNALSSACNKVFLTDLIQTQDLRFSEDMTLYEDLEFVLQYLQYCDRIQCLDRVFYHYRLLLQAPHLHQRVAELSSLQHNLASLIVTVLSLDSLEAAQQSANLCAQLFDQHLMSAAYTKADLTLAAEKIRNDAALTMLSQVGAKPSFDSSASWAMLKSGQISKLYYSLQKRRLLRRAKQITKTALKTIGLYR